MADRPVENSLSNGGKSAEHLSSAAAKKTAPVDRKVCRAIPGPGDIEMGRSSSRSLTQTTKRDVKSFSSIHKPHTLLPCGRKFGNANLSATWRTRTLKPKMIILLPEEGIGVEQ